VYSLLQKRARHPMSAKNGAQPHSSNAGVRKEKKRRGVWCCKTSEENDKICLEGQSSVRRTTSVLAARRLRDSERGRDKERNGQQKTRQSHSGWGRSPSSERETLTEKTSTSIEYERRTKPGTRKGAGLGFSAGAALLGGKGLIPYPEQ